MRLLYDAGALVAADRNHREVWTEHLALLQAGGSPRTTAAVVAQVSRNPRQANLRRFLGGCDILPFANDEAHQVGVLLARSGTSDVVDAHLVLRATAEDLTVLTSDVDDIEWLAEAAGVALTVRRV